MKKIMYEFADGVKDIEVTDEFAEAYEKIIEEEKKVERKEIRRHSSLEEIEETGYQFSTSETNFVDEMEKIEREEKERLGADKKRSTESLASMLRWEKRILKKVMTPRQLEAYWACAYEFQKKADIAKKMGITEGAVRKLIKKAEIKAHQAFWDGKF